MLQKDLTLTSFQIDPYDAVAMRRFLGWPPASLTGDVTPAFDHEVANYNTRMHLVRWAKCCHNAPVECRTWCHHTVLSGYTGHKTEQDQGLDLPDSELLHQPSALGLRHTQLKRRDASSDERDE